LKWTAAMSLIWSEVRRTVRADAEAIAKGTGLDDLAGGEGTLNELRENSRARGNLHSSDRTIKTNHFQFQGLPFPCIHQSRGTACGRVGDRCHL